MSTILIFGKNPVLVEKVVAFVRSYDFEVFAASTVEEAKALVDANLVDAFIIGGGVEFRERYEVTDHCEEKYPNVKNIQHYGNPLTDSLIEEIRSSLKEKQA